MSVDVRLGRSAMASRLNLPLLQRRAPAQSLEELKLAFLPIYP